MTPTKAPTEIIPRTDWVDGKSYLIDVYTHVHDLTNHPQYGSVATRNNNSDVLLTLGMQFFDVFERFLLLLPLKEITHIDEGYSVGLVLVFYLTEVVFEVLLALSKATLCVDEDEEMVHLSTFVALLLLLFPHH
jgi:hypothetical protein